MQWMQHSHIVYMHVYVYVCTYIYIYSFKQILIYPQRVYSVFQRPEPLKRSRIALGMGRKDQPLGWRA